MTALRLCHDAWIVVCDAMKVLFLRNAGDARLPDLRVIERMDAPDSGRTSDQGTDRPGLLQNRSAPASTIEQTDWHDQAKDDFALRIAGRLDQLHREGPASPIVLVAPPRILGSLRRALGPAASASVEAEIAKDLTKHPVHEIERLLTAGR
ncbi:host attachment protein [Inquilinus limosus]|uniref:host attachment protein n=1 Tax=Inquilinus limosus TaxID=171674 RepID=UPI000479E17B|nr:host attachment family protein [Inquilinus limosus]